MEHQQRKAWATARDAREELGISERTLARQWPPQTRQALAPQVSNPQLPGALSLAPLRGGDG